MSHGGVYIVSAEVSVYAVVGISNDEQRGKARRTMPDVTKKRSVLQTGASLGNITRKDDYMNGSDGGLASEVIYGTERGNTHPRVS